MKNIQTAAVCAVLCLLPRLTQAQQITRQQMPPQPPRLTAYGVSHTAGMDLDGNYYRISAENLELLFSRIEQELQNTAEYAAAAAAAQAAQRMRQITESEWRQELQREQKRTQLWQGTAAAAAITAAAGIAGICVMSALR